MLRVENVATPATAATVAVPDKVPSPGLVPSAAVTLPLHPVAVLPSASWRGSGPRRRDGDAGGGMPRLNAEPQRRRGTDGDVERGARGRRHAGGGGGERVARPYLVDAEVREGRDAPYGRHAGGAREGAATRVRPNRHRHVAPEPSRYVALRVERGHLDRRRDRGARGGVARLHAEHELRRRSRRDVEPRARLRREAGSRRGGRVTRSDLIDAQACEGGDATRRLAGSGAR